MSEIQPNIKTNIIIEIIPSATPAQELNVSHKFTVKVNPVELNISDALAESILSIFDRSIQTYIDEPRRLKTVLNYGSDKQSIILNQRYGTTDPESTVTQLKLLQPVPDDISTDRLVFIGREIAQTVTDKIRVRFAPEIDNTPFLRPKNTKVQVKVDTGNYLKNVTLSKLLVSSGSIGTLDQYNNIDFTDSVLRQWYSDDFNSAELNIDFTNYENFTFYSSAAMRLMAFKEKLKLIEKLSVQKTQFINNSYTASVYAGSTYVQEQGAQISAQIENIIRGFDRYEQYLYFTPSGSNSPYSASFAYADTGTEYNSVGYWPKISGTQLYSVTSSQAEIWLNDQLDIARRYDEFNENNLVNTIPTHIREDEESDAYITFVTMIGHLFDTIKLYIDQYPYIYSRNLNPNEQLSKDLITDVAESLGFTLPSINSKNALVSAMIDNNSEESRRTFTTELHKRLLHNFPMFLKTKGTRNALEVLLRALGLSSEFINIKESGAPSEDTYYAYDEYSAGIQFDGLSGSYIELPIAASSRTSKTLQVNCSFGSFQDMTILNGDNVWSLQVVKHPTISKYGRLELTTGSAHAIILSSSYEELFDDRLINFAIVTNTSSTKLIVNKLYNTEILYSSSMEISSSVFNFNTIWNSTNKIYLGGSGSLIVNPYIGKLDEVRLWSSSLTDDVIKINANDPGSIINNSYNDALYALYIQLSFNKTPFSGSITSIQNESSYLNKTNSPSLATIPAINVTGTNVVKYSREIKEQTPVMGSTVYMNNKVVVAPPPQFTPASFDSNGTKILSRTRSIKKPETKKLLSGKNIISITTSPTDIVNQTIKRIFGAENVNDVLGLPPTYSKAISAVTKLRNFYNEYYKVNVDINLYIRIVEEVNSILTQIIDYFIPARASLLKGIVIEPNLLEQVKIDMSKDTRVYGKNTRRTINAPGSLTSSAPDYQATFNVSDEIKVEEVRSVKADKPTYSDRVDNPPTFNISSSYNYLTSSVSYVYDSLVTSSFNYYYLKHIDYYTLLLADEAGTSWADVKKKNTENSGIDSMLWKMNKISYNDANYGYFGAEPYGRIYPRKLFPYEIAADRIGGPRSINPEALYDIKPSTNFTDQGVYTYYNNPNGVYYFKTTEFKYSYLKPVNFESATTWSYGSSYNYYDVVYQNVNSDETNIPSEIQKYAKTGNGRYYVFTTRASYRPPDETVAYYSGSVPTFIPPSLDKNNWQLLKFVPIQKRQPRRVVFVNNPAQNNYNTTNISIDRIVDKPSRNVDLYQIQSVPANSYITGRILLQNLLSLLAIQSNASGLRVRFYRTESARNADISRALTVLPSNSDGVLLDMTLGTENAIENINPAVQFVSDGVPPSGLIYYTINNLTTSDKSLINLYLYYFSYEVQTRVPRGYLRKHYRFFRDNTTATKRRNYVGCKNTTETTYDGLPPVQIFLGEGNQLTVANTISNTEVIPGGDGALGGTGGGTLNVI